MFIEIIESENKQGRVELLKCNDCDAIGESSLLLFEPFFAQA